MGRRNVLRPFKLLTAQSLAADFNSAATNIEQIDVVTYHIVTAAVTANTGQFAIQVRLKKDDNSFSDWNTLTFVPVIAALANADATFTVSVENLGFTETRLTFDTSGTPDGTVTVWVSGMAKGA